MSSGGITTKFGKLSKTDKSDWIPYYNMYISEEFGINNLDDLGKYIGSNRNILSKYFKKFNLTLKKTKKSKKTRRINTLLEGKEASCKIHGLHENWRIYKSRDRYTSSCRYCIAEQSKIRRDSNRLKTLLTYAKGRGKDFNLTLEYLESLLVSQNNKCVYTGIEFDENNNFSLDRIDSDKGYVIGNVQFVLYDVNRIKSNLTEDRFIEICNLVATWKGGK